MRVDLFDFELPPERIALRPASPRESARLLGVSGNGLADRRIADLPGLLSPGDVLVFNDTKVIPAQLFGARERTGAREGEGIAQIEATLHMRLSPSSWAAFVRPAKRVRTGDTIRFASAAGETLTGEVTARGDAGEATLTFAQSGPDLDAAIASVGHVPLPPYIAAKRGDDAQDRADYQTIYAKDPGAVAAPTAGLHFTDDLMRKIRARGVGMEFLTLHVGAGTFLPVKAEATEDHKMHAEIGHLDAATADRLNRVRASGGRIVCVGTTSLRLLESAAGDDGRLAPFSGPTDIFITPGYRFKAVDRLMTNFHLPRSTLFMLVSAFCGLARMRDAYDHAIAAEYRFYSYGDACLLDRVDP
ncbi:tRNA preQ1(34) S-adenosylmethionine ribosyltransferase-isomerase QueA [Fulvimarina sp. 2208YS6-2-32]|uniref:S-adenosylmethionine:tRNA ribosyltransferase-isomerase n=1 Tax=Fulvimarina uroteuthidis TaxID=3098149 RepID=A0ABU5I3S9_9HYPH|nr:tRNA preQ1(34) S-adenosylmethionine ribosyltransferase-isomerase QueA [Fulvimarina sp. 2208YS6-2-32]MDY8110040.1 tRNA preQ1(34) S-adenosylmethionine ribosyltransferase-isomerase QueA [Fulvimarina sp. 2208YS6-2-32]